MGLVKLSDDLLVRYDAKGDRQQRPVNFAEILKGKQEDFLVEANDIVFVPSSNMKNLGYSTLGALASSLAYLPIYAIP